MIPSDTYHIDKPFQSSFVKGTSAFLAFLILAAIVAQWVGYSSLSVTLPPPVVAEKVPSFNVKLNYLDAFVRRYGSVDCLLLGSSHIDRGLDPTVIERVYFEETNTKIHCFNFGLGTLTADTSGPLLSALIKKYRPSVVIFEISARSFSDRFGDLTTPLQTNPWIRYQNGERSSKGWALEHLYLYRYYLSFKTWQYPGNRNIMLSNWRQSDENGFSPHPVSEVDLSDEVNTQGITDFQIARTYWNGFIHLLALQDQTYLIVMEAPIQESYMPYYLKGGIAAYENEFINPVQQELSKREIPFWRALEEVSPHLSDDMWFNSRHLNVRGAEVFSSWLGYKMSQGIPLSIFSEK